MRLHHPKTQVPPNAENPERPVPCQAGPGDLPEPGIQIDFISQLIQTKRILMVVGGGGVGKTSVAAALGLQAALMGRKTMVLTIDPARRLANAFGFRAFTSDSQTISPELFQEANLQPRASLSARMLGLKESCDDLIAAHAPDDATRQAILNHPLYEQASTSVAGSHDIVALEVLYRLLDEDDYDLIVVDTPPIHHTETVLDTPLRLKRGLDWNRLRRLFSPLVGSAKPSIPSKDQENPATAQDTHAPSVSHHPLRLARIGVWVILKGIAKFCGLDALTSVGHLLMALSGLFDGIIERTNLVLKLLQSDICSFLLVTSPEQSRVEEALILRHMLEQERALSFGGFIVNGVEPIIHHSPSKDSFSWDLHQMDPMAKILDQTADRLVSLGNLPLKDAREITASAWTWWFHRARADMMALERLASSCVVCGEAIDRRPAPIVTVPLLDTEIHNLTGLHIMGSNLLKLPPRPRCSPNPAGPPSLAHGEKR